MNAGLLMVLLLVSILMQNALSSELGNLRLEEDGYEEDGAEFLQEVV